ncbi:MAG TPA: sensor histidine kinase [Streptosporangiaceae bacterium]
MAEPEVKATEPRTHAWELSPPSWDWFYAVVFVVNVVVAERAPLTTVARVVLSVALAAMVPWYLLVGRPQVYGGLVSARSWVYLAGISALFGVAVYQTPNAWFLAFALSPQCFFMLPFGPAMAAVLMFNAVGAVVLIVRHPGQSILVQSLLNAAFGIGLAFVYGRFAYTIIGQSQERAELIGQLEATRAELAAANHQAGTLAERQRLAGEIHDTLAQGFSSIIVLLQAAETGLGPDTAGPVRQQISLATQTARENLAEARGLVTALAPAGLAEGNLPGALRRITERAQAETGVDAAFSEEGEPRPLPAALDVVLLRIAQEAMANVRKHAAARTVRVGLCYADGMVSLHVSDDGCGFVTGGATGGYGLRGMRERVTQVDGRFEITSTPGAGTRLRAEVPA